MAINFEAANMAGYNNPRIEVFKATIDPVTNVISDAPSKTEIIRCLRRGSIPAILRTAPDGSEISLYWFMGVITDETGDTIAFGTDKYTIIYTPSEDTPIVNAAGG